MIHKINETSKSKSVKDDHVIDCILESEPLNEDLDTTYKSMDVFIFYMFKYKSSWCPNRRDSHDSKSCFFAHHMRDFRRPPEIFKYIAEDCEHLKNSSSETGWESCPKGLNCNKCHTTVERLYHPDKYKRVYCDRGRCNKSEICAFYHN